MEVKINKAILTDGARAESVADGATELTDADEILGAALDVGEYMLKYGGEVHRVEDTVHRICIAYGATDADIFAITSLILATVRMKDGTYASHIRRVSPASTHLARLEELNRLSRRICSSPIPPKEVRETVVKIRDMRPVPVWLAYVGAALTTSAFSVFFGGTLYDGLAAAVIGILMTLISRINHVKINEMARLFIMSLISGTLSALSASVGFGDNVDKIAIGTIMLVIPGLAFGNALRDLLCGEIIAGSMRFIQAVLAALMIALGYMAAFIMCSFLPFT